MEKTAFGCMLFIRSADLERSSPEVAPSHPLQLVFTLSACQPVDTVKYGAEIRSLFAYMYFAFEDCVYIIIMRQITPEFSVYFPLFTAASTCKPGGVSHSLRLKQFKLALSHMQLASFTSLMWKTCFPFH